MYLHKWMLRGDIDMECGLIDHEYIPLFTTIIQAFISKMPMQQIHFVVISLYEP